MEKFDTTQSKCFTYDFGEDEFGFRFVEQVMLETKQVLICRYWQVQPVRVSGADVDLALRFIAEPRPQGSEALLHRQQVQVQGQNLSAQRCGASQDGRPVPAQ